MSSAHNRNSNNNKKSKKNEIPHFDANVRARLRQEKDIRHGAPAQHNDRQQNMIISNVAGSHNMAFN